LTTRTESSRRGGEYFDRIIGDQIKANLNSLIGIKFFLMAFSDGGYSEWSSPCQITGQCGSQSQSVQEPGARSWNLESRSRHASNAPVNPESLVAWEPLLAPN
jgi:hypothetical protein